jgi:hypothetical protein
MLWPLLFVGLAAWLRLRNITAIDTWQDEDHQLSGVLVWKNIVKLAAMSEQVPLNYFNSYLMLKIGGVNLFSARLLSAILGSLAVVPFYRLLTNLVRKESAILGSVLFLGNTLLWSLSQEGRPYMAAIFLLQISLQIWVEFYRDPEKRHLWVALVAAQATLFLTLAMQPQFAYGFYFIPLAALSLAGRRMHLKAYASATVLAGLLALPAVITAAIELQSVSQIQPFASGFLVDYWPSMVQSIRDSLGLLVWAAPLLPIALILKGRDTGTGALGKSLLALAIIYPFLFFFCFESVLSTPVRLRYISFLVVLYIIGLTYSLDRLALTKGYKYLAFAGAALFMVSASSAGSLKSRDPIWREFFEYISKNESTAGVGAVLDFSLERSYYIQGFRGAYLYTPLYKDKLSLRSDSERTATATGDLVRRLKENPEVRFAYLFFPAGDARDNLLFHLKFPPRPGRSSVGFGEAVAIKLEPKDGNLPRAIRETLMEAKSLDPRIGRAREYDELMSGLFMLENKCPSALKYWHRLSRANRYYPFRETFDYLKALLAERCGPN